MKIPDSFNVYYEKLTVPHPPLEAFLKLDFKFTIGIYMDYFTTQGVTVDVSTIGYYVRRYPITDLKTNPLQEVVFDKEYDIIIAFSKAIQGVFAYLDNPF